MKNIYLLFLGANLLIGIESTGQSIPTNDQVNFVSDIPHSVMASLLINAAGGTQVVDGIMANYGDDYSNALDDQDATKMTNPAENVGLLRNNVLLVIERRHTIESNDTLFLNLTGLHIRDYQWEINLQNMDAPGLTAFLTDAYLGTITPLDMTGKTNLNFSVVNIPGSYAPGRFKIIFSQLALGALPVNITTVSANRKGDKLISVNWKVENELNLLNYEIERSADGRNFKGIGTTTPFNNNGGASNYNFNDRAPLAADNFYRIKATSINGQIQYSITVKVSALKANSEISIFPNPVVGETINIQFEGQSGGSYKIELLNAAGSRIRSEIVQVSSGNSAKSFSRGKQTAAGNYTLIIISEDGTKTIKQVLIR